mgnify:CR=1 FL=1
MSKIIFNEDRCFGCGACINIAPDNFTYSDDGRTSMTDDSVNEAAIEASEICPASAIIIEDCCSCDDDCNCGEECACEDCHCDENCACCK